MIIRDLMQSPVKVIGKVDTVSHARKLMMREKLSRLVVVEGSQPVGTLTRRDIINGLNNHNIRQRELDFIVVEEIMRSPPIIVKESDSLGEAARKMVSNNIKGLPVVDDNRNLVGIITKTDLTRYFAENYGGKFKVGDICMAKDSLGVIRPTHSVNRAADIMRDQSLDRVVVVDGKTPIGVITETDLQSFNFPHAVTSFLKGGVRGKTREGDEVSHTRIYLIPIAEDMMTPNPITVEKSKDAADAAKLLIDNDIGGMPVVDKKGELVGMVTKFDFVKLLVKEA